MTVRDRTDVVVVGAGVIGASCAFQLARRGLDVTVLEVFDGPAEGSSGRSFASVRAQWADALNIELSWRSIQAYRDFEQTHGFDIGYRASGYLLLVPEHAWADHLRAVELQRAHGVPVDVLDVAAARAITPFAADGIAGATWGPADGVVDPHLAAGAWLTMARALGARVRFRRRVTAVGQAGDGWRVTAGGESVDCRYVVNAAGGWGGEVAALAGLEVPVVHSRRNVYATAPGALPGPLPMTIDVGSGVYLRSEGDRLLFAGAKPDEVDGHNVRVDWPWREKVLERGSARFPWLAELPLDRAGCWAGTYENTPDHHPVLGEAPGAPGWVNACGFSGHGVIQAPVAGRLVAEEIVDGGVRGVDIRALRLERFAEAHVDTAGLVF
ncbi:NAD(P)/FAD-dependent oxidoreductase [Streptomyces sp. NPDC101062]|uniref:NAD(P)/FAD-dependent oxidoreductase n=1 Tax=unclassified Streptomyces TaxID=2593676 RepID=UPI002E788688|nr:FAD-dependent oxidoreductase [Streptomyces sp. JV176]MEE1801137.1 FAD-dependent oxidoreductase [Streptomyces sp. JV176]